MDVDAQPELVGTFRVRSVPTVTFLRDGIVLASQSGAVSGDMLDEIVRQVQALAMDAVRRQVRNHQEIAPADRPPESGEAFV